VGPSYQADHTQSLRDLEEGSLDHLAERITARCSREHRQYVAEDNGGISPVSEDNHWVANYNLEEPDHKGGFAENNGEFRRDAEGGIPTTCPLGL
jgi:hypothetical protein